MYSVVILPISGLCVKSGFDSLSDAEEYAKKCALANMIDYAVVKIMSKTARVTNCYIEKVNPE